MSTQFSLNGFKIKKIEYNSVDREKDNIGQQYILNFNLKKINLSISKKQQKVIINILGKVECQSDEEVKPFRSLELDVDYSYSIYNGENLSETNLRQMSEDYGINNSIILFENLVKEITSLDYSEPVVFNKFKFPRNINLKPKK
ncbi:hypothetical protein [uncultured Lactobacillus sp.]|uniref:hypothetical protein n=1 Tax=uncultured Lactobacillus sp. TaxID=153152 RepID=UPI002806265B|nr:hypothetical protein [uncultured Lactobacillus sp.]